MKVIKINEIKPIVETVSKSVNGLVASVENKSEYVTNTLDAMSVSARAGINISAKKHILNKSEVLKEHKSSITEEVREFIENCKDGSEELLAVNDILGMVKKDGLGGRFDKDVLRGFSKNSKLISPILEDLKCLRKHGAEYVPTLDTREKAIAETKIGDVFQIKDDVVVSIKNRKGEIEPLKMSKEKYEELFPILDRYASYQSQFGNCYEITALNSVMERPEARENILRCIDTESKKGVVRIKFPNSSLREPIEIADIENSMYYSHGSKGLKYIEKALGKEYEKDFIDYKINELMRKGKDSQAMSVHTAYRNGNSEYLARRFGADNGQSLGTNLRDGGFALVPWYKLGFSKNGCAYTSDFKSAIDDNPKEYQVYKWANKMISDEHLTTDEDTFLERVWDPEFFKHHLVEAAVGDVSSNSKLSKGHSYRLSAVIDENNRVQSFLIKDPHGIVEQPLTIDELMSEVDSINFARID